MGRTLYRDAALADGTGPDLRLGVSVLVDADRIALDPAGRRRARPGTGWEVVDASGCTIVPGLVDSHSHLTLPGGAHWIDRGFDPPDRLLAAAEHNARLLRSAGVRWARDVGSPTGTDPVDGRPGRWRSACATAGPATASTRTCGRPGPGSSGPARCRAGSASRSTTATGCWPRRCGSSTTAPTW